MILIAVCNENEADFNENFRTYSQDRPPVQAVDKNRPVGEELSQLQF